ncbi:MAG: hypothetical protein MI861_01550, partial [Pirellulales bacterium]|nr:hypothetical protein [Pirellulales bacterium]
MQRGNTSALLRGQTRKHDFTKKVKRRKLKRALRMESLESRQMLAGDVTSLQAAFPNDVYENDGGYFPVAKFGASDGSTPDDYTAMVRWQDGVESIGFVRAQDDEFVVYVTRHFDKPAQ